MKVKYIFCLRRYLPFTITFYLEKYEAFSQFFRTEFLLCSFASMISSKLMTNRENKEIAREFRVPAPLYEP